MEFTEKVSDRLAPYVAEKYQSAPNVTIENKGLVGSSCYRLLVFHFVSPSRSIALYLSPDQRFLTPELLDTESDRLLGGRHSEIRTQTDLLRDPSPMEGTKDAPVTVVEFSDFQCPLCRRLSEFISDLGSDRDKVRIVFKQFPLPNHTWARRAALASICANFQGNKMFWSLQEFFFNHQDDITADNLEAKIAVFRKQNGLNEDAFHNCMIGKDAEGILLRDETLARRYRVDGTPIVFINGIRTTGFRSAIEFRAAISLALLHTSYAKPDTGSNIN